VAVRSELVFLIAIKHDYAPQITWIAVSLCEACFVRMLLGYKRKIKLRCELCLKPLSFLYALKLRYFL